MEKVELTRVDAEQVAVAIAMAIRKRKTDSLYSALVNALGVMTHALGWADQDPGVVLEESD